METYEGPSAYNDAIEFLKNQESLEPLKYDEKLGRSAHELVRDIGPKGLLSHETSDGRGVNDRVEQFGDWDGALCENMDVGSKTAKDVLIGFLVDDGIEDRSHRFNIFNKDLRIFGISSGMHSEYGHITVIDYACNVRNFNERPEKNFHMRMPESKKTRTGQNPFTVDDVDAPDDTISVEKKEIKKLEGGVEKRYTRKIYKLESGAMHIVDVEA